MKRVGIIGGMSYESTIRYYECINRQVNERAGGFTSADLVIRSVNFGEYYKLMESNEWGEIAHRLSSEALGLVLKDKCDYITIASNTMHKVADKVAGSHEIIDNAAWPPISSLLDIPFIHIGDCIAQECSSIGAERVLLLGTKYTMTDNFMSEALETYGISVMDASNYPKEIEEINRVIFEELCHGIVAVDSKEFMIDFVSQFLTSQSDARPEAVILGCTELGMILQPGDVDIPLIDSTQAHIDRIVEFCLMK